MGHYCTGYRLFLRKRANLTKEIQNLAGPRGKLRVARIVNLNLPEFSERDFFFLFPGLFVYPDVFDGFD